MNEGISMKRATEIEVGFKDLHEGLYDWGNMMFIESTSTGFIESVDGWRLKLPRYGAYIKALKENQAMTRGDWLMYSNGKKEWNAEKDAEEKDEEVYKVKDEEAYNYYRKNVFAISQFFKLKSSYQRLCLNSPVQTAGAHQLKLAKALYFEWIVENDFLSKILICNSVHDEVVAEAPEDLAEDARVNLERCMLEGGDYYLETLKIKADAHIGDSWYEAK
jgi:DNA polymerase I-like protein with 3'-5' exonuclease and polymerase domains